MKKYLSSRQLLWFTPMLLTICTSVFAQAMDAQKTGADTVTDAQAVVPAAPYRSVFKETSLGVEKDSDNWRKANDEVGKFLRGHVDILKWEEQESAKPTKDDTQKPAATPPVGTIAPQSKATNIIAAPTHKN